MFKALFSSHVCNLVKLHAKRNRLSLVRTTLEAEFKMQRNLLSFWICVWGKAWEETTELS